jgi:amidohydrolase
MKKDYSQFDQWLSETRRDFHVHPEISHQETRTTAKIVEVLKEFNCEVQLFDDMTGTVSILRGAQDGPTIGLRADIDALPIQELNDIPYKSQNPGAMHACGHDAHTTIMLGVARNIMGSGLQSKLKGNVKFFFQPAEERIAGAKAMIERGVLEDPRVDRVIAGHMAPDLPVGTVGVFRGLGYASADRFELNITGQGTHGARPEEGNDPIENDIEVAEFLYQISQEVLGKENVSYMSPIMGSEDFSYFTLERPSAIMRLGCSNSEKGLTRSLHSPYFDIDEQVLEIGVAIFTEAVVRYLS